jgi:hypothetical protein
MTLFDRIFVHRSALNQEKMIIYEQETYGIHFTIVAARHPILSAVQGKRK